MYGECVDVENLTARLLIINIEVFSDLYKLYCKKLFAAAPNFNRFDVNVAY